jgi:hypothetical protein
LCNLLADASLAVMAMSFTQPIRDAIRGLYFTGDPAVDFDAPDFRLPLGHDLDEVQSHIARVLADNFGTTTLGELAALQVKEGQPMWTTFAFEDGMLDERVLPLKTHFGTANVLEVWVGKVSDLAELPPVTEHPGHLYVPILSNEIDNDPLLDRFLLCFREWRERNGKAPL